MNENAEGGIADRRILDDSPRAAGRDRQISVDTILSAVGNEYRRAILATLHSASNETLEYDVLVEGVADRVGDDDSGREPDEHRRRIQIELHHTHLPKLAEARMVDYEAEPGLVQFVGGTLERDLLALIESHDLDE